MTSIPDFYIQRVDDLIRSGVNLNTVASFTVARLSNVINVTLSLIGGGGYIVSFTTEQELQDFVTKLEKIIN
jgi:hypothetical protein